MSTVAPKSPAASQSKQAVQPIPDGFRTVTPHLVCAGAAKAIDFYQAAFGAVEIDRLAAPDGTLLHAALRIGDSMIMLTDECPQMGARGPLALGGTPVTVHLFVEDVDAAFQRAVEAGATVRMPVGNMFWGDRYGSVMDPFGHAWSLATHQQDLTMQQIAENLRASGGCPGA